MGIPAIDRIGHVDTQEWVVMFRILFFSERRLSDAFTDSSASRDRGDDYLQWDDDVWLDTLEIIPI